MLIAIGSTNPVKINATKNALSKVFNNTKYVKFEAKSEVSEQPTTAMETRLGAYNRAKHAITQLNADIGVGLEGGVTETEIGMMTTAWCCIINKDGLTSYGGGMNFHLPDNIANRIRKGEELGPIMEELCKIKNVKQKQGTIGILTNNILTRTSVYQQLVELALPKIINFKWFS